MILVQEKCEFRSATDLHSRSFQNIIVYGLKMNKSPKIKVVVLHFGGGDEHFKFSDIGEVGCHFLLFFHFKTIVL